MPLPERQDRRRKPTVPLDHLQALLRRCRPHQQREQAVLTCLVQHKAVSRQLTEPLQTLQGLATAPPGAQQEQQQGGSASVPLRPRSAGMAASFTANCLWRCGGEACLQLSVSAASGQLTYGQELDRQLAALLAAEWCPFLAAGCSSSVEEDLAQGSLTAEGVAAAAGLPVALRVPLRLLRPAAGSTCADEGAPGDSGEALFPGDAPCGAPPEDNQLGDAWAVGVLLGIIGKRLCTALDFGQEQQGQQRQAGGGASCSQRATLAAVRVALPPQEESRLGSSALATPSIRELHWPCSQLWRLVGPSAAVLGGDAGGGILCAAGNERLGSSAAEAAPPASPPDVVGWALHGYCCGASILAAPGRSTGGGVGEPLRRSAHGQPQQAQQVQEGDAPPGGLLLRADLQAGELAVLAHLSSQPELLAAMRSGGSAGQAYQRVSHCWAAAAGRLDVPGTGNAAAGQAPVLVGEAVAEAAAHALVHGWSAKKLGWALRCSKEAAGQVLDSFLAAFPRLRAWLAVAAAQAEAACSAATLGGRQRSFPALQRANDALVGAAGRGRLFGRDTHCMFPTRHGVPAALAWLTCYCSHPRLLCPARLSVPIPLLSVL